MEFNSVEELLSDKSRWTIGAYAKDADGFIVRWCDPEAVCWCASGAIRKVYKNADAILKAQARLRDSLLGLGYNHKDPIVFANDIKGYDAIYEAVKRAGI